VFFRNIFSRKFYMDDEILSGIHCAERKRMKHTRSIPFLALDSILASVSFMSLHIFITTHTL